MRRYEGNIKTWLWNWMLTAAVVLLALSGEAQAQITDNDGCSNATLQGDYGVTVHGEFLGLVTAAGPQFFSTPVPIDAVPMTDFDGKGKFTQVGVNVVNGMVPPGPTDPETGFGVEQSGSYTVFPDCTGEFELNLPGPISISAKFVLAKEGREIHAVITREHVASPILGCTSSDGCDVLPQYRSDGTKLLSGAREND
jgi:hypothetical protein